MKRLIAIISAVLFLQAAPVTNYMPFGAASAEAGEFCDENSLSTRCGRVTKRQYGGGGNSPNVVPIQACLSERMFQSIRLRNGTSAWEAGFYYRAGKPEEVTTVRNSRCWTHYRDDVRQHGNPGSYAIAFICCDYYCGWVGGVIQANGNADMQPIRLSEGHDPLRSHRAGNYASTGEYNRRALLN